MVKPVRLQLSRRKGFNLQELSLATNGLPAVNVARPSKWGNPFPIPCSRMNGGEWERADDNAGVAHDPRDADLDIDRARAFMAEFMSDGEDPEPASC